jgi:hypothetical protein
MFFSSFYALGPLYFQKGLLSLPIRKDMGISSSAPPAKRKKQEVMLTQL